MTEIRTHGGPSALIAVLVILGSAALAYAEEPTTADLFADGKIKAVKETSIKCDSGADDFPDYISIERLPNCDSAKIVTVDPDLSAEPLIQFTIKPDDKEILGGIRAELGDMRIIKNGEERWYRLTTLIPADFPIDSPHRLVLAQWHGMHQEGTPVNRPPISHRLWNHEFAIELFNEQFVKEYGGKHKGRILYVAPELERGVFHEYVYKVIWAPDERGEIHAWKRVCDVSDPVDCTSDWEEFIQYKGSTGFDDKALQGYFFKYGLYTTESFDTPFTAYHADYRGGSSAADVGLTEAIFK